MAAPAAVALAAAAATTVVGVVDPNEAGHYPTCPFLWLTGRFCPGCGSLRAVHALTRGDVGAAIGHNVLAVAALVVLGWLWLRWTVRTWTGASPPRPAPAAVLLAGAALVVLFAVVRNLPFGAALAP
jgi:Protein of unknown function (DUF2752)